MSRLPFALVAALACAVTRARIHHLKMSNDNRFAFSIESFGFVQGGAMDITVHNLQVEPATASDGAAVAHRMGFVLFPAMSESSVAADVDALIARGGCALDYATDSGNTISVIDMSDPSTWAEKNEKLEVQGGGMFDLMWTHCEPAVANYKASFTLDYVFQNPGPNYLSAGEMPLPWVYGVLAILFAGAGGLWFWHMRRNLADVQKIHSLMSVLLVTKVLSLTFEAVMYHFIAVTGHSTGWNIAYYILTSVRGVLLVVVIGLIGAGWSLLKPFLTQREKRVLMVVLPLQILANIAIIVVDEMDPGTVAYSAWVNVLHVADVVAAVAVILPVVWSIKHLREAQEADRGDEKTKDTLVRLTQFRTFYILTIAWLYFTRIVVLLIGAAIAWDRQWMAPLAAEATTLGYYLWTGYRFRPAPDNSDYLRVPQDDDGPVSAATAGEGGVELAAGAATAAAAGRGVAIDDDEEEAKGTASGSATRVKAAPTQTILAAPHASESDKEAAVASYGGSGGGAAAEAPTASGKAAAAAASTAASGSKAAKAPVAIADDDANEDDDEFDLDAEEDDDLALGIRRAPTVSSAASSSAPVPGTVTRNGGGGLKNLRPKAEDDDF